jgi:hypothetical protein
VWLGEAVEAVPFIGQAGELRRPGGAGVEGLGSGEDRAAVLEFNSAVSTLKQGNRRWGSVD